MILSDVDSCVVQREAKAQLCSVVWIVKSTFPSSKSPVSSDCSNPRAPISFHFCRGAVKSLFMGYLTPKTYCCHMLNNTSVNNGRVWG